MRVILIGCSTFSPPALLLLRPPCSPVSLQSVLPYLPVCLSTCSPVVTCLTVCLSVCPLLCQSCGFQVGMKLEAVDKKNPGLVCVASVTDVMDDRFLVHFDNWDDTYDYWSDRQAAVPVFVQQVGQQTDVDTCCG